MSRTGEFDTLLKNILAGKDFLVTYVPLRTEVPFREIVTLPGVPAYEIPPRAALDPLAEAAKVIALARGKEACILMPGRRFDSAGTRHGQGGGWYDRFLSKVPREWTRIGFCFEHQYSASPLPRQPWDEQMDYVVVSASGEAVLHTAPPRN